MGTRVEITTLVHVLNQGVSGHMEISNTRYRRDKVALKTTRIKNAKVEIIKIRRGCQNIGYL